MEGKRRLFFFSLLLLLVFSIILLCTSAVKDGEGNEKGEKSPDPIERAFGLRNGWQAVWSWTKLKLMDLKSKSRGKSYERSGSHHPGEVVKEATKQTAKTSKEMAEQAAKSAAEVVDDAMHTAKEKVKKTVSNKASVQPNAEL